MYAGSLGVGLLHCSCQALIDTCLGRGRRAQRAPWQTASTSWPRWLPGYEKKELKRGAQRAVMSCTCNLTPLLVNEYSRIQNEACSKNALIFKYCMIPQDSKPEMKCVFLRFPFVPVFLLSPLALLDLISSFILLFYPSWKTNGKTTTPPPHPMPSRHKDEGHSKDRFTL